MSINASKLQVITPVGSGKI